MRLSYEYCLKALAMSEGRSARAHRALGMHHYFRKEYGKAVEHMTMSLELNSFQGRNSGLIPIFTRFYRALSK